MSLLLCFQRGQAQRVVHGLHSRNRLRLRPIQPPHRWDFQCQERRLILLQILRSIQIITTQGVSLMNTSGSVYYLLLRAELLKGNSEQSDLYLSLYCLFSFFWWEHWTYYRAVEFEQKSKAEEDVLRKTNEELQAGQQKLERYMGDMDRDLKEIESNLTLLKDKYEQLKQVIYYHLCFYLFPFVRYNWIDRFHYWRIFVISFSFWPFSLVHWPDVGRFRKERSWRG